MSAWEPRGGSPALPLLPHPDRLLHAGERGCASGCCSHVCRLSQDNTLPARQAWPRHWAGWSWASGSTGLVVAEPCRVSELCPETPRQRRLTGGETEAGSM